MPTQDQKPRWAQQFNIDDVTWENLVSQAQKIHASPLSIALDSGLLNENKVLLWDRDISGVASIKSNFFNGPLPQELFTNIDYDRCMLASCMPIMKWNNVIYWAKISSDPTGFEKELPQVVWVLAPWTGMKKWFGEWKENISSQNPSSHEQAPAPDLSGPVGLNIKMDDIPAPEPLLKSTPEPKSDVVPPLPVLEEKKPDEVPIGLTADSAGTVSIDFSGLKIDSGDHAGEAEQEKPVKPEMAPPPPPLPKQNIAAEEAPAKTQVFELDVVLGEITNIRTSQEPPPVPSVQNDAPTAAASASALASATPLPIPQQHNMPPIPNLSKPQVAPQPATPSPGYSKNTGIHVNVLVPTDQIDGRIHAATNQDDLAKVILSGWQAYFNSLMILLLQNDQLIIWCYNDQWSGKFGKGETIPLDTPSIFKIVADTAHAYHGYVTPGPVNDGFFKKTNDGKYPEHVSIIPVVAGDHVVAMLLGTCTKDAGKTIALSKLEQNARNFGTSLVSLMHPNTKAS